ncbi:MAG TPA: PIN domain-containing protein [Vicinamibacteria bacterium]
MIFVDTSFFFALASERDPDHDRVREIFDEIDPARLPDLCLTTNHVVMETVRLARRQIGHQAAVDMGNRLYGETIARVHWTTPEQERAAFEYLADRPDQRYSPVDCVSFIVMDAHGIDEALTIDRDFTHRYVARPGPRPR